MIRILLFSVIFFFGTKIVFSQSNLQFSGAVLINISGTQSPTYTASIVVFKDTTLSVPAGKVWKVESANISLQYANPAYGYQIPDMNVSGTGFYLLLNKQVVAKREAVTYPDNNFNQKFPIWLPQGNYPIRIMGQFGNLYNSYTCFGSLSILEFNIVQ